jgi:hypothetical protein
LIEIHLFEREKVALYFAVENTEAIGFQPSLSAAASNGG